jgi:hypothetical protein
MEILTIRNGQEIQSGSHFPRRGAIVS